MNQLDSRIAQEFSPAAYPVHTTGVGIVHLGPGAFHRAHQAVFTEQALAHGGDWRICGVQMRSSGVRDALAPQDYRYTLATLDQVCQLQVIHAMADILVASEDLGRVLALLAAPTTHIITLTITEKGYCLTPAGTLDCQRPEILADLKNPSSPQSAIGLLSAALARRRQQNLQNLTIISCDNLSDNGKLLGAAVEQFARLIDPDLALWIGQYVAFPCSMVDAITPATDDKLRDRVMEQAHYKDAMPVSREAFSQWVIEERFSGPRPAWEKVGVTFAQDVGPFETAKIRLLNGAHSALAYLGMLRQHTTVLEAVSDHSLCQFIRAMMLEEICPTLAKTPGLDLPTYCDQILQRFGNPEIAYKLRQIAGDGSQKVRFRFFATIEDNLRAGRKATRLVSAVAAWLQFIRRCHQRGETMNDPLEQPLGEVAAGCRGDAAQDIKAFLSTPDLFTDGLSNSTDFGHQLVQAYQAIETQNNNYFIDLNHSPTPYQAQKSS